MEFFKKRLKHRAPRRALNADGLIRLDGGFATRRCRVIEMSETGARLLVDGADKIPNAFVLLLAKVGEGRRVIVKWRRGNEIGVQFV